MRTLTTALVVLAGVVVLENRDNLRLEGDSAASRLLARTIENVSRPLERSARTLVAAFAHTGDAFARAHDRVRVTAWRGGYVVRGTAHVTRIATVQAMSSSSEARISAVAVMSDTLQAESSSIVASVRGVVERVVLPITRIGRFVGVTYVRSGRKSKKEACCDVESSSGVAGIDG